MFRPTSKQGSLLQANLVLPKPLVKRLKTSWAQPFRDRLLPLIDEELFRDAFHQSNGRPNKSIRLLVGAHILKEAFDLTDDQLIEQFAFNVLYHFALGIDAGDVYVPQKTLHNFRVRLADNDRAMSLFTDLTRKLIEVDGISVSKQRLDSTHIQSNFARLTRLGLFVETVRKFLAVLRKAAPGAFALVPSSMRQRYLERSGNFADARRDQARRRLARTAEDAFELWTLFRNDPEVEALEGYGLLQRLLEDQCEVIDAEGKLQPLVTDGAEVDDDDDDDHWDSGDGDDGTARIQLRDPKTVAPDSLQTPHDPDVTYGHKGKGAELQIVETCDGDNAYQVVTALQVDGAHESDQRAVAPLLEGIGNLSQHLIRPPTPASPVLGAKRIVILSAHLLRPP